MSWESLHEEFTEFLKNNKQVHAHWVKADSGKATYRDAMDYSRLVGSELFELIEKHLGKQTEVEDIEQYAVDVAKGIEQGYSSTAYFSKTVQKGINDRNRIGIKAIEPKLDDDRMQHLKEAIALGAVALTSGIITNNTDTAVTDTINANAREQDEAGITVYVTRDTFGQCCDWCESNAGTHVYGEEPKEFWQKHKDCSCEWNFTARKNTRTSTISRGSSRVR